MLEPFDDFREVCRLIDNEFENAWGVIQQVSDDLGLEPRCLVAEGPAWIVRG